MNEDELYHFKQRWNVHRSMRQRMTRINTEHKLEISGEIPLSFVPFSFNNMCNLESLFGPIRCLFLLAAYFAHFAESFCFDACAYACVQ